MSVDAILVHYGEIALKGRNRPVFIQHLARNIRAALSGLPVAHVEILTGRLLVIARPGEDLGDESLKRLSHVYGITSFAPTLRCPLDLDAIKQTALSLVEGRTYASFRVSARRAFKDLPFHSMELNRDVGAFLWLHRPAQVKMEGADLDVRIEVLPKAAYLYVDRTPGLGGLPVGVTGKVCVLLSGGIDSPVAAWRMQRRGCEAMFVHFHGHPYVTKASLEKAQDLVERLARFQQRATLYAVAFGGLQSRIVETAPPPLRVVLYRRFMVRIAGALAQRERAKVLVTGESLAQVASQTLTNMIVIDKAAPLPVLRPLVAFDKYEIINEAMRVGTYEISIQPDQDCCTLFTPRNPETHAKLERVEAAEAEFDVDAMVAEAVTQAERTRIRAPWIADDGD